MEADIQYVVIRTYVISCTAYAKSANEPTLEMVMPCWTLDVFHALYELRHADDMPDYAHRICRADRAALTKAALAPIPMGTQVVREHPETLQDHVTYIWGSVQGYSAPCWRVRYEDSDWEDFTKRQLLAAIALAESVRKRAISLGGNATVAAPVITQTMLPAMPADFGPAYLNQTVRVRMGTGWSRGELIECHKRASLFTCRIQFNGLPANQLTTVRLHANNYAAATAADAHTCPIGSWNLLLTTIGEIPAPDIIDTTAADDEDSTPC
jgi:hypothetical protein